MAFGGFVFLCLLIISLMLQTKSDDSFVSVQCQSSDIVAHYGTNTLLDCVVRAKLENTEIVTVSWTLNKAAALNFRRGQVESKKAEFQFAVSSWDKSNLNVSLLITDTKLEHAGKFKCDVVADTGTGSAIVELSVKSNYSKPEIHSNPEKIIPEKDFTLTCTAHNGYPEGSIRWMGDEDAEVQVKKNPEVQVKKNPDGLYDLTSTLSVGANSPLRRFVCEVFDDKGEKEGQQEKHIAFSGQSTGEKGESLPYTHIVAPAVVIGSLIVGLLVAVLLCHRRRQMARRPSAAPLMNYPPHDPVEANAINIENDV